MGISYELAPELQEKINELSKMLFPHVKLNSVIALRSYGSTSRGTIARCHALGKAMQIALGRKGFYVIEVISSRFDRMSEEDKIRTLIHELMHIPKSFGGGFIHHNIVHERNVDRVYEKYISLKRKEDYLRKFGFNPEKNKFMPEEENKDSNSSFFSVSPKPKKKEGFDDENNFNYDSVKAVDLPKNSEERQSSFAVKKKRFWF